MTATISRSRRRLECAEHSYTTPSPDIFRQAHRDERLSIITSMQIIGEIKKDSPADGRVFYWSDR